MSGVPDRLRGRLTIRMARDHIVPRMLLRRFAGAGKHLLATPRSGGSRIPMTVSRACREAGFYDIDIDRALATLLPQSDRDVASGFRRSGISVG